MDFQIPCFPCAVATLIITELVESETHSVEGRSSYSN